MLRGFPNVKRVAIELRSAMNKPRQEDFDVLGQAVTDLHDLFSAHMNIFDGFSISETATMQHSFNLDGRGVEEWQEDPIARQPGAEKPQDEDLEWLAFLEGLDAQKSVVEWLEKTQAEGDQEMADV